MSLESLNRMSEAEARTALQTCCAADRWIDAMVAARPYVCVEALHAKAASLWPTLTDQDWLLAFDAHPKIGDVTSLKKKYANTHTLASGEQASTAVADETVLQRLKGGNDAYLEKFGFIFIVCATGKSAAEMLALLEERLTNSRQQEIENAAREQAKITHLRLDKLA